MRILLDEQLDWRLGRSFGPTHTVESVRDRGWVGMSNGELLHAAESDFDVFVTLDRNLRYQQDLDRFELAVIMLTALTNRLEDTEPFVPEIEAFLSHGVQPRQAYVISAPSQDQDAG